MKNNSISLSNALRMYLGGGRAPFSPVLFFGSIILYGIMMAFMLLIGMIDNSFDFGETKHEMFSNWISDFIMAMMLGPVIATECSLTYEKRLPGGKFFRTVKGGFETYEQFRKALVMTMVLQSAVYCIFAGILHAVGLVPLCGGLNTCIATFVFSLLGICLGNVSVVVRNDFLRGVAGALLVIGIIAAGTSLLILTEGKLSFIHYIAAAAAAVLLPVSTKAMLAYYKKNCWLEDR